MIVDFLDWFNINHLQFNISKTKVMVIHFQMKRAPLPPVTIEGIVVEVVSYRYLTVQMDDKLDWSNHMEVVYNKG